jgi:hypothetical protein
MSDPTQWMPPRDDHHRNAIDPRVVEFARGRATINGRFSHVVFANSLVWPKNTRKAPPYYKTFAEQWKDLMGVPEKISGIAAAGVLHVIISAMKPLDGSPADYACFLKITTIAQRAHTSRSVVNRVIRWQRDAPLPLVEITKPASTSGFSHPGVSRFTLVTFPIEYARNRDQTRGHKQTEFHEQWTSGDVQEEKIQLQKRLLNEQISQAEYDAGIAALQEKARGTLPKRVCHCGKQRL